MRTFQRTHPWLKFALDLRPVPYDLWIRLGECQSKCEHVAGVPLRSDTAAQLYQIYLAKGARATTAIEGNTLSEEEVLRRVRGESELPRSRQYLGQEVDNIIAECNRVVEMLRTGTTPSLTVARIKELNGIVLRGLPLNNDVTPGEIRRQSVGVGRYRGAPAEECEYLVEQLCTWLESERRRVPAGLAIAFAIVHAVVAHVYIAWIHPFDDGNGRTARLLEYQLLLGSGVPAPACHLLSNFYNETRTEYYRQLDRASHSGGDLIPFIDYAVTGLLDGLREQLRVIRDQQWDVTWRDFVFWSFRDRVGTAERRRRDLLLELSRMDAPVPVGKLAQVSPSIAASYARLSQKAVTRDLHALVQMDLVARTSEGYRARKERILAFLPPRSEYDLEHPEG